MKKIALGASLTLLAGAAQAATILGVELGGNLWRTDNQLQETSLHTDKSVATSVYGVLEHPIPLVPNIRAEYLHNKNDIKGGGSSSTSHTDLTLYYELLDNWVNLDLGVTGRKLDAEATVPGFKAKADPTLAAGYVRAQFDLPFTGLSVGAAAHHGANINGSQRMRDYDAYARYEVALGFGVGAGYRVQYYRLNYDGAMQKHKIDGAYANAFWRF